jgi:hypothetical protein
LSSCVVVALNVLEKSESVEDEWGSKQQQTIAPPVPANIIEGSIGAATHTLRYLPFTNFIAR